MFSSSIGMRVLLLTLALTGLSSLTAQQPATFPRTTAVGADATPQMITLTLPHGGSLHAIKVLTQGVENLDFSAASGGGSCAPQRQYLPAQQCTVLVGFHPTSPGQRRGAVVLLDGNNAPLATQWIVGSAAGSVATFIPGTITTVAGNAAWIYAGDGAAATGSSIFLPFGVAVDAAGNLFLADSSNNRIRRVDAATGTISTVAGNGLIGYSGDGGAALSAALSNPSSLTLDAAGNLYFSDSGNNVVRRIDAFTATISTVAGSATLHGYSGDNLPATQAALNGPNGLALDAAGNLYIADSANNVVRLVTAATGIISTIAGNGAPGFSGDSGPALSASLNNPWSIAFGPSGELYIADQNNQRIRKVSASGIISTFAGIGSTGFTGDLGPANQAQLNVPSSVVVDVAGNVYIADSGNNRVRKVGAQTGTIITIAGNGGQSFGGDYGPATQGGLYGPYGLSLDDQGSLFIADVFHNRIRKVASNQATLLFDAMRVGRVSAPKTQILENDGNASLTPQALTSITNSQIDAANTTCSSSLTLAPLDTCVISAAFAPTVVGNPTVGTLNLTSTAADPIASLALAGQVLNVDPSTILVTSSGNPSTTGAPVTFSVTVTSAGTTPTGNVTLLDGTVVLGVSSLQAGGKTSFTVSTLAAGQHSITASYVGDGSNSSGVSSPLVQTVQDVQAATVTNLASSAASLDAGSSLRLTSNVAVATAGAGSGALTGNVTFSDGTRVLGTAAIVSGAATLSISNLTAGPHLITAAYLGNATYASSTSAALAETVTLATTHIAASSSANPANAGTPLTLSATIFSTGGTPTGLITFSDQGRSLGTASLNGQGIATLVVPGATVTPGTHALTASYAGDSNDSASSSQPLSEIVNLATSTLLLGASTNPAALGASISFTITATSNGGTPGGSVQVFDGPTPLGSATLSPAGVATLTTSALGLGNHSITASYPGDSNDSPATSPALSEVVQPTTIAVSLGSSANPSKFNTPVTLSLAVTGSGSQPTGSVTLTDNGAALTTVPLDARGLAVFSTSSLTIGTHTIIAVYSGDTNHTAATSAALTQRVVQVTSLTLTSDSPETVAGLPTTFSAALTGASGQSITGPIVLHEGSATLATLIPNASGTATFSTATLTPGVHTITGVYAGDALNASVTSAPLLQAVDIAITSTGLTSNGNPTLTGAPLTLNAAVRGNGALPTGSVTFSDAGNPLGTVALSNGSASLTLGTLSPGIHQLSAAYAGDTDDRASVSPALTQQIAARTIASVTASANPSLLTDSVTLTITVANGATTPPTGTVSLTDNGASIPPATLDGSGRATITLTAPALGAHTLIATYAGDRQNVPATSQPLVQTVVLRPTTATFNTSSTNLSAGQQLILISVVQPDSAAPRPPTGQVTFQSGSTVLGTAAISAAGVATLTVTATQANLNTTATYSGDSLYAPSTSPAIIIVVGPPIEFTLSTVGVLALQSGQHASLQINVATAPTFTDTIAFGCAGLPASATCTFSQNQVAVANGQAKTLTVTVDTGNPLGAGAMAGLTPAYQGHSRGPLLCLLPAGALLALLRRRRLDFKLLSILLTAATLATLSGCAASFTQNATPPGNYTFQIVATGAQTAATQTATVQMKVTQ